MSALALVYLVTAVWVAIVVIAALDTLVPLLIGAAPRGTGRKILRLGVLAAGLCLVLRVALSIHSLGGLS